MKQLFLVAALGSVVGVSVAQAKPSLVTIDAWTAPTSAENAPVYLSLVNHETKDDRLLGASTPIAEVAELMTAGKHPRHVEGVDLPSGEATALGPRAPHLVLMDIDAPLRPGASFPLTLAFRRAGNIETEVVVSRKGARPASRAPSSESTGKPPSPR